MRLVFLAAKPGLLNSFGVYLPVLMKQILFFVFWQSLAPLAVVNLPWSVPDLFQLSNGDNLFLMGVHLLMDAKSGPFIY